MENDLLTWAELLLTAVLQKGDAEPVVALAMRAGVDLDALQSFVNLTLDRLGDDLAVAAGLIACRHQRYGDCSAPQLSEADVAVLRELGIDGR